MHLLIVGFETSWDFDSAPNEANCFVRLTCSLLEGTLYIDMCQTHTHVYMYIYTCFFHSKIQTLPPKCVIPHSLTLTVDSLRLVEGGLSFGLPSLKNPPSTSFLAFIFFLTPQPFLNPCQKASNPFCVTPEPVFFFPRTRFL